MRVYMWCTGDAFAFRRAHSEIPCALQGVVRLRRGSAPRDILALLACSPAIACYIYSSYTQGDSGVWGTAGSEEQYGIRIYGVWSRQDLKNVDRGVFVRSP